MRTIWLQLMAGLMVFLAVESAGQSAEGIRRFDVVSERNIFNRHRSAPKPPEPEPVVSAVEADPVVRERIVLNGVMIDGTNAFGFFDGDDSEYRKVVRQGGEIGGLKLLRLTSSAVVLGSGTNEWTVRVSDELEREGDEPWVVVANHGRSPTRSGGGYTADSSGSGESGGEESSGDSGDGDGEAGMSDVLKRLLEKRRKEAGE